MASATITVDYDGRIGGGPAFSKDDTGTTILVGIDKGAIDYRGYYKFLTNAVPNGSNVTKVEFKVYCRVAGGASHQCDVHAYSSDGSDNDPQVDVGATLYNRCASGNLYLNDLLDFRTTGLKTLTLGNGELAQACLDFEAAMVIGYFSVGLEEEGANDAFCELDSEETVGGTKAQLVVTYTPPTPPPAPPRGGEVLMDGFVFLETVFIKKCVELFWG